MKATRHENQPWARRRLMVLALVLLGSACDGSKGGSPIHPSAWKIISLDGNMAFGTIDVGSSWEATLRISNNGTEPLTVTGVSFVLTPNWSGVFSSSWTSGTISAGSSQTATIRFTPLGAVSYNGTLTVSGNYTSGSNTMPVSGTGERDIPYRRSGTGNTEFFIPTDVEHVRIVATYNGNNATFMVDDGWEVFIDERLGTASNQTRYEGTHRLLGFGDIRISNSSGVAWSFEEIR